MNDLTVLYIIVLVWLAPWLISLIYMMYKFKKLNNKLERFIEENLHDDDEETSE